MYAQFKESILPSQFLRQNKVQHTPYAAPKRIMVPAYSQAFRQPNFIGFSLHVYVPAVRHHNVSVIRIFQNIFPKTCHVCFTFYQDRRRKAIVNCLPYKDRIFLPLKLSAFFSMRLLSISFCQNFFVNFQKGCFFRLYQSQNVTIVYLYGAVSSGLVQGTFLKVYELRYRFKNL